MKGEMQAYRVETVVTEDGTLIIKGVPFRTGATVEVIIFSQFHRAKRSARYPLRGKPIRYPAPFESVAESEWEVLQ